MPVLHHKLLGRDKPPPGCVVDGGDPLARDLALCLAFNDAAQPRDYSPYRQIPATGLTPTELSPPAQSAGRRNGLAANFAGGALELNFARKAAGRIADTGATCSAFVLFTTGAGTTFGLTQVGQRIDSNDALSIAANAGSLRWYDPSSASWAIGTVAANTSYAVGVSQRSATSRLLALNGAVASNTTTSGSNTIGATNPFTAGVTYTNAARQTGQDFTGLLDLLCWWYRPLTAGELLRLNERPFSFFVVPQRWVPASAPAAGVAPPRPVVLGCDPHWSQVYEKWAGRRSPGLRPEPATLPRRRRRRRSPEESLRRSPVRQAA